MGLQALREMVAYKDGRIEREGLEKQRDTKASLWEAHMCDFQLQIDSKVHVIFILRGSSDYRLEKWLRLRGFPSYENEK